MNKIKILPDNLANQIAAGEVVERPASVVKELVENALDAGARRIQIETELGGRRLMRVSDDGGGMVRDDAILAFERHATSKIKSLEDLSRIETLGFRGEALASIASVAKVELITKTADTDAATRVYIEGGRLIDVKEIGRSQGTTIAVRDLFFNTPARRKFMRSEATENYHIASIVTHYALANPQIAFILTGNGREVLRLSPARDLRERAYQIFGAQMIESLLPVAGGREYVAKISGFVSAPRERRTTRDAQYFFINGRFVRDKIIAGGLLEGFRAVHPHGVYPVAFLFLEIPLEEVDVNVHPAKTEVRFRRSEAVKEVIGEAIRGALRNAGIVANQESKVESREFTLKNQSNDLLIELNSQPIYQTNFEQPKIEFPLETQAAEINNQQSLAGEKSFENTNQASIEPAETQNFEIPISSADFEESAQRKETYDLPITNYELKDKEHLSTDNAQLSTSLLVDSGAKIPKSIEVENLSGGKIRPIGQLRESFIIATDDEGMLLIDQHVAHERILFDKFRHRENERKVESQNLLLPETIDLTPAQSVAFDLVEEELENCGFGLMRLSGRTVAIKSVPTDLPASEVRNLFAEILETIASDKRGNARETLRDHIAATLACKAAVKINMKLTPEKMQWMIDKLLTTSSPTTCPHGRPVILRLTMKDIERGFHRT
jgi:DNA mismatch repair protein MutL